jgi:serine/threonine protein phosphatase PrpC
MRNETLDLGSKWRIVSHFKLIFYEAHCIVDSAGGDANCGIFAIFDGHGGKQVSEYCAERFPAEMRKEL